MSTKEDNTHLKYIVEKRLPQLLVDIIAITESEFSKSRNKSFIFDLGLISDVYSKTKRFDIGLGFSYSYLPRFRYDNTSFIDLTGYQPLSTLGNYNPRKTSINYNPSVDQQSFPSVIVSAEVKYIGVVLTVPMYEKTIETISDVKYTTLNENSDIAAYRNTSSTTFKIDFDLGLKFSLRDYIQRWRPWHFPQFDYGFGFGVTSVKIKDTTITDLRLTDDITKTFNDIEQSITLTNEESKDFITNYYMIFAKLEVSDTYEIGFDFKSYKNEVANSAKLIMEGTAISMNFTYNF